MNLMTKFNPKAEIVSLSGLLLLLYFRALRQRGYFSCSSWSALTRSILFLPLPVRFGGGVTSYALLANQEQSNVSAYRHIVSLFRRNFAFGDELGAQLTIFHNGKAVIDAWGSMDAHQTTNGLYDGNSLQTIFSSTKVLTSLCICILADRGHLKLEDKVSKHWPEFAQNGKEGIRICDVLRHEAGLAALASETEPEDGSKDYNITLQDIQNLDAMAKIIAKARPYWKDGIRRSYHSMTRGFILAEIVRRTDPSGRSLQVFFDEEVSKPLNADTWIGTPLVIQEEFHIADMTLIDSTRQWVESYVNPVDESLKKQMSDPNGMFTRRIPMKGKAGSVAAFNTVEYRSAQIGSAGGISNGRGLGRIAAMVSNMGRLNDTKVVSKGGIQKMLDAPKIAFDSALCMESSFTAGGICCFDETPSFVSWKGGKWFGWGGRGGSAIAFCPDRNLALAYTMNAMHNDLLGGRRLDKIVQILNKEIV